MESQTKLPDYNQQVINALYEVVDPELNINIVDLGLVYAVDIDVQNKVVTIQMTLSTPSCPLGGLISCHAKTAAESSMPGYRADVNLVWTPKWDMSKVTKKGIALLGW